MTRKQVLSIAGSDSGAGAGVQADLKTFSALRVYGATVITSVTSQNTKSVNEIFDLPKKHIESQIKSILDDFEIKAVKIGMLHTKKVMESVFESLIDRNLKVVLDPVMVAESRDLLLQPEALGLYKNKFLEIADILTPNRVEAQKLSGTMIENERDLIDAARKIIEFGPSYVVVTGGNEDGDDFIVTKANSKKLEGKRFKVKSHGSGCTFSSAIASYIARGFSDFNSIKKAHKFTKNTIKYSHSVGSGSKPVNQFAINEIEIQKHRALENTKEAIRNLPTGFEKLIPQVGTNIAMSIKKPEDVNDVVGVPGRIVSTDEGFEVVGCPRFGGSSHVARLLIEANSFNEETRAAMNIKYSNRYIERLKKEGLSIESFKREEVSEKNTMTSGTKKAINKFGGVPDVIYDRGDIGKEPMIRILGHSSTGVVKKIEPLI